MEFILHGAGGIIVAGIWLSALWACGFFASRIFKRKNRDPVKGWIVGLIFGIVGVVIAALLRTRPQEVMQTVQCPRCHFNNFVPASLTELDCQECDQELMLTTPVDGR